MADGNADALEKLQRAIDLHAARRLEAAAAAYREVLALDGGQAVAHHNLGAALRDLGRSGEAAACFETALRLRPDYTDACVNLGLCRMDAGDHHAAVAVLERALALDPAHVNARIAYGVALCTVGRLQEAAAENRRVLEADPDHPQALNNLANALRAQGRLPEAAGLYRRAIAGNGGDVTHRLNLGLALVDMGRVVEAIDIFGEAAGRKPDVAAIHTNLGNAHALIHQYDPAIAAQRTAVALEPGDVKHLVNLGTALRGKGLLEEAEAVFRRALTLEAGHDYPYNNLGNLLRDQGRVEEAVALYRQAVAINPRYATAFSNLLFTLNSLPGVSADDVFAEHRRFGEVFAADLPPPAPFANSRDPDRVLRLGYASPDLLSHSVTWFLEPLLEARDRSRFHITCYADNHRADDVTRRLAGLVDAWRVTTGLSDDRFHDLVKADGIDILVDLAGHTAGNRLRVFARRAAPVQITAIGYPNTTGLATMDGRITDAWADPPSDTDRFHTERLIRLPHGFLCYRPFAQAPAVATRPSVTGAAVSFGSFNALSKMTDAVIALWAAILSRVPGSRLVLKTFALADAGTARLVRERFAAHGIAPDRLTPLARTDALAGHLGAYGRLDIALDPFPYNGTTTTCEALWMGVPVITLAGDRHVARVGVSLLSRVGLDDLVAGSPADYVEKAVALANDRPRLDRLSRDLRLRMAASPLCDAPGTARAMEAAYRDFWRGWCAKAPPLDTPVATAPAPWVPSQPPPTLFDAGVAHLQAGELDKAEAVFQAILASYPRLPEALLNLGTIRKRQGRPADAEILFRQAIAAHPTLAGAHASLGAALLDLGRADEAETACRHAIQLDPGLRNGHVNLGLVLHAQQRAEEALTVFSRALAIGPASPETLINHGVLLASLGRLEEAVQATGEAVALGGTGTVEALANLASYLVAQGRLKEAIVAHRQVVERRPDMGLAVSNFLFALNYDADLTAREVFAEHRHWGARIGAAATVPPVPDTDPDNDPTPGRRLKVGYVSADLCGHAVAFFLVPLLAAHAAHEVEVFCYGQIAGTDPFTDQIRRHADHWRLITGTDDDTVARMIRADGIDILVDLGGHTSRNRLAVFAQKPAPVHITWLGYPNTTGLPAMDYRLTDAVADPYGLADPLHTERLVRLPRGFLCYRPGPSPPDVSPLPAATHGAVTFGSFNNLSKVTPAVVALWARLLRRLPDARLLLKAKALADAGTRRRYLARFADHGIAAGRIAMVAWQPYLKSHLEVYHRVDIALDTFPYNGTTTTCEALHMGVPVVTLAGDRHAARVGASLLTQAGLTDLIAVDEDGYIEAAAGLADDLDHLADCRASLRGRLEASPLRDESGFARSVEAAYRTLWRGWCRTRRPTRLEEAVALYRAGRLGEAEDRYHQILARQPDHVQALNFLGVIAARSGRLDQAMDLMRRAIALRPDYAGACNNLGGVLRELGRPDEAAGCFRQALAIQPDYPDALYNLETIESTPGAGLSSARTGNVPAKGTAKRM